MNLRNFCSGLALCILCCTPSLTLAGNEGRGSYSDQQGINLIKASADKLVPLVQNANLKMFTDYPARRKTTVDSLRSVQISSTTNRTRNGRELLWDFDPINQRIIALKPFFEGFKVAAVNAENIFTVEMMLLHETAHLWGDNDDQAELFANSLLKGMVSYSNSPDFCTIKYEYDGFGGRLFYWSGTVDEGGRFYYMERDDLLDSALAHIRTFRNLGLCNMAPRPRCLIEYEKRSGEHYLGILNERNEWNLVTPERLLDSALARLSQLRNLGLCH